MRFLRALGGLLLTLLLELLFHLLGLAALAGLLALHFWLGLSIWWFVGALGVWIAILELRGRFLDSASRAAARPDVPPRPRKTVLPVGKAPGEGASVREEP